MKRIVPLLLAALMVLTMVVTAAGYSMLGYWTYTNDPRTDLNTSDTYDRTAENLFAANGTPTVDGVVDDMWKNAFTYVNDKGTVEAKFNLNLRHGWTNNTTSGHSEIRLMWDENNLYILEQRFDENYDYSDNATPDYFKDCWSNGDQTNFNILLPTTLTEWGDAIAHQVMFCVPQGLTETQNIDGLDVVVPKAVGTVAPSIMYAREIIITSTRPAAYKEYVRDFTNERDGVYAGVQSFTAITETGYLQESVIPWSTLCYGNLENTEYKGELGGEFGIKMYMNYDSDTGTKVYHINQFAYDGTLNTSDWMGHAVVKLVDSVSEYIVPDTSWYDPTATEFEIADAADLLGLVYLTHSWNKLGGVDAADATLGIPALPASKPSDPKKNMFNTDGEGTRDEEMIATYQAYYDAMVAQDLAASAYVTAGKTFKIMNDIDLNPGYTGAANTRPGNIWYGLLTFAGTLDGQGHTIKGLYNDAMYGTGFFDEMGLVANLTATGVIKDLTLEGTFIADSEDDSLTDGIAGVKADGATVTNVTVANLLCKVGNPDDYVTETPSDETPSDETPSSDVPSSEVPSDETPSGEVPSDETPSSEVPSDETPSDETPSSEVPSEETPSGEAPSEETPSDETPTEKATEEKKTDDKKDDDKKEDKGCASVAGGAVVALLAIAAVPAICRKKED